MPFNFDFDCVTVRAISFDFVMVRAVSLDFRLLFLVRCFALRGGISLRSVNAVGESTWNVPALEFRLCNGKGH